MSNENSVGKHVLPDSELTIYTAASAKLRIMSWVERCATLEVDLSKVCEIDTAGVQLLLLAKRECEARDGELHLSGHTGAVLEVLEMCNLLPHFRDPVFLGSASC